MSPFWINDDGLLSLTGGGVIGTIDKSHIAEVRALLARISRPSITADADCWQRKIKAANADWKWVQIDPNERDEWERLGYEVRALFTHPAPEGAAETESQTPAVATIRSVQGAAMEAASATGKPPVGAASTIAGDTEPGARQDIEVRIGAAVRYANRTIKPVTDQPIASCCEGAAAAIVLDALEASGYSIVPLSALTSLRAERDYAVAADEASMEYIENMRLVLGQCQDRALSAESSLAAEKQRADKAECHEDAQRSAIGMLTRRAEAAEQRVAAKNEALIAARSHLVTLGGNPCDDPNGDQIQLAVLGVIDMALKDNVRAAAALSEV